MSALNPTRAGPSPRQLQRQSSETGTWADFSTGDRGGDPVSLAAYIFGTSQVEAARTLAVALGVRL